MLKAGKTFTKKSLEQLDICLNQPELRPLSADQLSNARDYQPHNFMRENEAEIAVENSKLKTDVWDFIDQFS